MEQERERPAPDDAESESDRRLTNIFLLVFFLVVVGTGIWLVNAMVDHRKLDDCLATGRRGCAPIDVPAR
jgi:hypothetical protein